MTRPTTRDSILLAAVELFRQFGYNGTSLKQISEGSGAPIGSVYHHFPGGKEQLTAAAIDDSGPRYQATIEALLDAAADLPAGVYSVFEGAGLLLAETDYQDPCPIGGIAREVAKLNGPLREHCSAVFSAWSAALVDRLQRAGVPATRAAELADAIVAAIEGGFILARTHRSAKPLEGIGRAMQQLVATAIDR